MKKKENFVFLLLLLILLTTGFFVSLGYPYRARLFPIIIIISCGILVLIELRKAILGRTGSDSAVNAEAVAEAKQKRRRFAAATAWIGGFALMIWLFGFVIGLPLFIFTYLKTHGERWLWTIALPAAMFVIVYIGFGVLLESPLYEGLLFLQQ